jgi:anti-sigma factor RsiW
VNDKDDTPLSDEELRLAKEGEALIAAAVADTQAPQSLREAIERERERAQAAPEAPFWRRHLRALAGAAAVVAAMAGVVVALETGSNETAPSLAAVEAAGRAEATRPAPSPNGGEPATLAARVAPISFPDWRQSFGWRAVGSREDEISGRTVKTVFYRNPDGARLGYSIVAGDPLREHPPGHEVTRAGNTYHVALAGGHTLVTWTQQGHTCSIVGPSTIPAGRLVDLAASRNPSPA